MKIPFFQRWTSSLICEIEIPDDTDERWRVKVALEVGVKAKQSFAGAYLAGANLAGANLAGAYLAGANLAGANFAGANLAGANLTEANLTEANLTGANLKVARLAGANLTWANLDGANLAGANLTEANLTEANLTGANLKVARLTGANLDRANLDGANLAGANLAGASLHGASLDGANLAGASLTGANLDRANLRSIRSDLVDVLLRAIPEVPNLLQALREGRVDGSAYTGKCACLSGTIAKARGVDWESLSFVDSSRPAERWFLGISKGDTPETNEVAKITEGWIIEFMSLIGIADAQKEK